MNEMGTPGAEVHVQRAGLSMGQLIDRTFRLLRARWKLYVSLSAVPAGVMIAWIAVICIVGFAVLFPEIRDHPNQFDPRTMIRLYPIIAVFYISILPVFALYAAAAAYAVVRTNLGETVKARQAWAAARRRIGRLIWLAILMGLIVMAPLLALSVVSIGMTLAFAPSMSNAAPPPAFFAFFPLIMLLVLGSYVYMILMFLRYSLSFATCVIEDLPAAAALRRSAQLTRRAKGRIFVVLLVMYAATYALILVLEIALFLVGGVGVLVAAAMHVNVHSAGFLFLVVPLAALAAIAFMLVVYTLPYAGYSTALGVLYCDQRYRESGVLPVLAAGGETA